MNSLKRKRKQMISQRKRIRMLPKINLLKILSKKLKRKQMEIKLVFYQKLYHKKVMETNNKPLNKQQILRRRKQIQVKYNLKIKQRTQLLKTLLLKIPQKPIKVLRLSQIKSNPQLQNKTTLLVLIVTTILSKRK